MLLCKSLIYFIACYKEDQYCLNIFIIFGHNWILSNCQVFHFCQNEKTNCPTYNILFEFRKKKITANSWRYLVTRVPHDPSTPCRNFTNFWIKMTVLVNSVSSLQCKFFTHADSISVLDKLILAQNMYFSIIIQLTEPYFKFLSCKLVSYQNTFTGSVISE